MKYTFLLSLLFVSSFGFSQEKINIVTSATIFADMVEQVGGDKVNVKSICAVGTDPHTYEPIPNDVISISNAKLVFVNGLSLEGWMDKVIENAGATSRKKVLTEGVNAITSEDFKNATDPHAWMDLRNGIVYAENIKNALVEVDSKNTDYYNERFNTYKEELLKLHQYITESIASIPAKQRLMITSHDAFEYYSRAYNIKVSALQGMSTEAEAQTSDLIRINKQIKDSGVPAIFAESTINPKMQEEIARQNNVTIGGELFADSLGEKDSEASTYAKMLKHNTNTITEALKKEKTAPTKEDNEGSSNLWLYVGIGALMLLSLLGALKFLK